MIQTQVVNLVIGVVPRPTGIMHATSDGVGACGAKLLNGFANTSGRPAYSFPSGSRSIHQHLRTWQARLFLLRKGPPAGGWFANHPQRNPEPAGHCFAAALVGVIGGQNPFSQIKGDGLHPRRRPPPITNGYRLIYCALVHVKRGQDLNDLRQHAAFTVADHGLSAIEAGGLP